MPLRIGDIFEFVAAVELDDIVIHEERSRLLFWSDEELASTELPVNVSTMGMSNDSKKYLFRFRTRFTDRSAEYIADCEVAYVLPEAIDVDPAIVSDFAGRVAFMAVYPFLRASIFGSAARLGKPIPILGVVRQGEFNQGDAMTSEQTTKEFLDNRSEIAPVVLAD